LNVILDRFLRNAQRGCQVSFFSLWALFKRLPRATKCLAYCINCLWWKCLYWNIVHYQW